MLQSGLVWPDSPVHYSAVAEVPDSKPLEGKVLVRAQAVHNLHKASREAR